MGKIVVIILSLVLCGCGATRDVALPALKQADVVRIKCTVGPNLPITEITDTIVIEKMTGFINAVPNRWEVPWYGPPIGAVYFHFYKNGELVGNIYLGPNFFGRDDGRFLSQRASPEQIQEFGRIIGVDLLKYLKEIDSKRSSAAAGGHR